MGSHFLAAASFSAIIATFSASLILYMFVVRTKWTTAAPAANASSPLSNVVRCDGAPLAWLASLSTNQPGGCLGSIRTHFHTNSYTTRVSLPDGSSPLEEQLVPEGSPFVFGNYSPRALAIGPLVPLDGLEQIDPY